MPSNTVTTYGTVGNREDLIEKVFSIAPSDTPLASAIDRVSANSTFHEWQTDTLQAAVVGGGAIEGSDASYAAKAPTVRLGNYTMILKNAFSVSNTQEAVNHAGPNQLARITANTMKELKKNIEANIIASSTASAGAVGTGRSMRGLKGALATNFFGGTGSSAPVYGVPGTAPVAGTARAYSETILKQALSQTFTAGGNVSMLLMTPNTKQVQSAFTGNVARQQVVNGQGDTLNTAYTIYGSDFGDVKCVPNRIMAQISDNAVYGVDTSMLALATLRGFETQELAVTGDAKNFEIRWEGTLEHRNEAASFQIRDLSGT